MLPIGYKPLLAVDFNKVKQQPTNRYVCEKLDGIRCVIFGGKAYSRSLKLIPNVFIQEYCGQYATQLEGIDCEIIVGNKNATDVFNVSTSGVMRQQGTPDFKLYVFDRWHPTESFQARYSRLKATELPSKAELLEVHLVDNLYTGQQQINLLEQHYLALGAEGIMIRDAFGIYKHGRSGTINPELQKVKRFQTEEFRITGYEPKYVNQNEQVTNELGRSSRSTHKQGLVAVDQLGALTLVTVQGLEFSVGSGLTDASRTELWNSRDKLVGKLASIKYFAVGTGYDVPRFPVLRGIRSEIDL